MPRHLIQRRMPWGRNRYWRPGEPITLDDDGDAVTYLLRGVMRDTDPASEFATLTLELVRAVADEDVRGVDPLSAAG